MKIIKYKIVGYKNILLLVILYIAAHWILPIMSGIWWDDWIIWTSNANTIKELFWEAGAPWEAYNLFSVMWIPNKGYRVVVFILFFIGGLLFYKILANIDDVFSEKDAFWIAAIYLTIPVNDARVTLICYGYTLSLFLFLVAFYLVSLMKEWSGKKRCLARIFSLILFFYSYNMESLLVIMSVTWLYLLYICWKSNREKTILKRMVIFFFSNGDYLALPFIFYILKKIFFKPYGLYVGYNNVTLKSLIRGALSLPIASIKTFITIWYNYKKQINTVSVIVILLLIVIYTLVKWKRKENEGITSVLHNLKMLFLGVVVYWAGIFPYIVVRGSQVLGSVGVGGRDSMLAGFGISFIMYYFVRLLYNPQIAQNVALILIIMLGIFHFNDWYLNYQEDWYYQLEFAEKIADNFNIKQGNTFLCDFSYTSPCNGMTFYVLNGISYWVTGRQDKFYFTGERDLGNGITFNEQFLSGYNANDYDASDTTIDGVLLINNEPMNNRELLNMRFEEIVHPNDFKERIRKMKNIDYIKIDKETSDRIYCVYSGNRYNSSVLRGLIESE